MEITDELKQVTIDTYSGTYFHVFDPREGEINITDIAHALSNICRFTGHCEPFYSVAEHCVRVSYILPGRLKLAGLLHDAAEAYISDINGAYKWALPLIGEADDMITHTIYHKFSIQLPSESEHKVIKHADMVLRATERRDLMKNGHNNHWDSMEGYTPLTQVIYPLSPDQARKFFMTEYEILMSE